jgi:hypothetical protein
MRTLPDNVLAGGADGETDVWIESGGVGGLSRDRALWPIGIAAIALMKPNVVVRPVMLNVVQVRVGTLSRVGRGCER